MKKRPFYQSLYVQVIAAIIVGILLGHFLPGVGEAMKPLGDGFIKLIKMLIAPIIFCTVVVGIAGMEDMKKVGKTGGLALLYFEIVTTIALIVGLIIVNVVQPGAGMNIDPASLDAKAVAQYTGPGKMETTTEFIMHIIPTTIVDAFAKGEILQILLISVLFGFALHSFGGRGTLVFDLIEKSSHVLFGIVGIIMKVAPIGAFGAMAFTIGRYGVDSLLPLAKLMGTFYLTCVVFIALVLGGIARAHGFSIWKFIRYIKEELLICLGTSSSESVLPRMMAKMENLGVEKSSRRTGDPHWILVQLGRHGDLSDDGGCLYRSGYEHAVGPDASADIAGSVVAYLQRRSRHNGQRFHRLGCNALRRRPCPSRGSGTHSRHRSLYVGGQGAYQSHWQWSRNSGGWQMVRRARRKSIASPPRSGD